jgi:hypothetical protein
MSPLHEGHEAARGDLIAASSPAAGAHLAPGLATLATMAVLAASAVTTCGGCTRPPEEEVTVQRSALEVPLELHERAGDGHVLYRQVRTPALPDTERPPLHALFLAGPESSRAPQRLLPLELVVDARLAPKGGVVAALTETGRLVLIDPSHPGPERTVDSGVHPGLAFSPDGSLLAYSRRDDDPRPELHLFDRRRGEGRALLDRALGPADRPAFSADGDFLFVVGGDARTGLTQLWALAVASGQCTVLTNVDLPAPRGDGRAPEGFVPVPVGPVPARHTGGQLVYHAGDATVSLPIELDARTGSAKAGTARVEPVATEESR